MGDEVFGRYLPMKVDDSEEPWQDLPAGELIYANGVNGSGGGLLLPGLRPEEVAAVALGGTIDLEDRQDLEKRRSDDSTPHFGVEAGRDPADLGSSGWGVIFPGVAPNDAAGRTRVDALREALSPLLRLRARQANQHEPLYKELAYFPGETKNKFLERYKAGPGPAVPPVVPYYLLIVGGPEEIPYRFQYLLDVQYAVGRIHFETLEEYHNYALSVVAAEMHGLRLPRRAVFFGVKNPDDQATSLSTDHMIKPLAGTFATRGAPDGWQIETVVTPDASKDRLARLLGGAETPAFLFTASHGLGLDQSDRRQLRHNGAIVGQEWPGPRRHSGPVPEAMYFSSDDIASDARMQGLIAFCFACYGAGTPDIDEFVTVSGKRVQIAERPFVASLPRKMLGLAKGGALAVIGHVERAWGHSFLWGRAGRQLAVFESTIQQLVDGMPVGMATEYMNGRYAELGSEMAELWDRSKIEALDTNLVSGVWTAHADARNYAVIGDPAVRLNLANDAVADQERARIAGEVPRLALAIKEQGLDTVIGPASGAAAGTGESSGRQRREAIAAKVAQAIADALKDEPGVTIETYVGDRLFSARFNNDDGSFGGQGVTRTATSTTPPAGDAEPTKVVVLLAPERR